MYKYRNLLNEGNVILFEIDIVKNIQDNRYIIKRMTDFDSYYNKFTKKINIYTSLKVFNEKKEDLLNSEINPNENIFLYTNVDNKLVSLNFNNKYSLKSYILLDSLKKSKKLDYSIELS